MSPRECDGAAEPAARRFLACLDVWTPAVQEAVRRNAPPELDLHFARSYDEAEQAALIAQADFALVGWARVSEALLANAPRLRFIEKWGIGVDRIDVDAARRRGIGLAITAGSNAGPVAEHAIMLMLAVSRRLAQADAALRQGRWLKAEMRELCHQLGGKTVGLYGFGHIGRSVARKLSGFEARILYTDPQRADADTERALNATRVDVAVLLAESDILSLHAPATPQTRRMLDARALAAMKPGAILINTARGELVDTAALLDALRSGHLRGAGLDAFDPEPPPDDCPLYALDQVVLTPHMGGAAFDNVEHVARHALGNIMKVLRGEPLAPSDIVVEPR